MARAKAGLDAKSKAYLESMPKRALEGAYKGLKRAMYDLEADAVQGFEKSGLHSKTGNLKNSIWTKPPKSAQDLVGLLGANKVYAAIHELGGTTKPHVIKGKNTKTGRLKFEVGGKYVYPKQVNHPGATMPKRSFLWSAITRSMPSMYNALSKAINKEFEK